MNSHKIHRVVEYIRRVGFDYDTQDLEEISLQEILAEYGYNVELSLEEKVVLESALHDMAGENQTREMVRLAAGEEED